jgi:hypothetical protein
LTFPVTRVGIEIGGEETPPLSSPRRSNKMKKRKKKDRNIDRHIYTPVQATSIIPTISDR